MCSSSYIVGLMLSALHTLHQRMRGRSAVNTAQMKRRLRTTITTLLMLFTFLVCFQSPKKQQQQLNVVDKLATRRPMVGICVRTTI
jgi:hypothetical protein